MSRDEPMVLEKEIRRTRARPQMIVAGAVVGGLVLISVIGWLLLRPKPDTFTLSSYTYAEAARRALQEILQVSGTMDVDLRQDVVAMQHGTLDVLAVEVGDRVRKGQVLARISAEDLQDQLSQQESALSKAMRDLDRLVLENRYDAARMDRERPALERAASTAAEARAAAEKLRADGFASEKDLKTARDAESAAREALAKADADREQAAALFELSRTNLQADISILKSGISRLGEQIGECSIYAPFDGTILEVYADRGAWITQYQKLFHIADTGTAVARLDVPETAVGRLSVGQSVSVLCGSGRLDGTVRKIGLQAEVSSSGSTPTVPVEVGFTRPPASVIPGSSASGDILLGVKKDALVLPRGAYLTSGEESSVYRIQGGEARKVQVVYGLITADTVEVVTGLGEGDRVITSGYQDFIDRPLIQLKANGGKKQ